MANQTVTGPLDAAAADAGRGHPDHLQRRITEQLEQIERDQLHRDMQQLPTTDTRRLAWFAVDRLSSQWVSSWPTHRMELSLHEMLEVVTTYLGRESPAVRRLAGRHIPCSHASRQGQGRVCDAFGFQLGLATLPGGSNEECHDVAGRELFEIIQEARLSIELQPRHFFHTLIPVARLLQPGRHPSIVPDASMRVALADVVTQRPPAQRGPVQPARRLLFDVKTIHAGSGHYYSLRGREEQSGAVHDRELQVWTDYQSHARALDRAHSPAGQQPILDRLRSFGRTRGLIYGAYGEASHDVHALISIAADARARELWRAHGASSVAAMRSFLVSQARRRVGMAAVQAMARHRLDRLPFVGCSRAVVQARAQRRQGQGRDAWDHVREQYVYDELALYQGGGWGAGAGA